MITLETGTHTAPQTILTKVVVLDYRVLRSELKEILMQTDNRNPFPHPVVSISSESDMGQGCWQGRDKLLRDNTKIVLRQSESDGWGRGIKGWGIKGLWQGVIKQQPLLKRSERKL